MSNAQVVSRLTLVLCCLQNFISDIRACQNKDQEKMRVDKELGKIRKKFSTGNVVTGGRFPDALSSVMMRPGRIPQALTGLCCCCCSRGAE